MKQFKLNENTIVYALDVGDSEKDPLFMAHDIRTGKPQGAVFLLYDDPEGYNINDPDKSKIDSFRASFLPVKGIDKWDHIKIVGDISSPSFKEFVQKAQKQHWIEKERRNLKQLRKAFGKENPSPGIER